MNWKVLPYQQGSKEWIDWSTSVKFFTKIVEHIEETTSLKTALILS